MEISGGTEYKSARPGNGRSAAARMYSTISIEVFDRTHAIWDEIAGRSAGRIEEATNHLMAALCQLHGCDYAAWIGAQRMQRVPDGDRLNGWRPLVLQQLEHREPYQAHFKLGRKRIETEDVSFTTVRNAQMAGVFRATRLCDLLPERWFESEQYARYLAADIADLVTVVFPVSEHCESYFMFVRTARQPRFSENERDALAYAMRGIRWFHRHIALFYGVLHASAPLTATERKALRSLLAGGSDKDIAAALEIGVHSAREHVATLYRKFDVSSRTELMALWLGCGE